MLIGVVLVLFPTPVYTKLAMEWDPSASKQSFFVRIRKNRFWCPACGKDAGVIGNLSSHCDKPTHLEAVIAGVYKPAPESLRVPLKRPQSAIFVGNSHDDERPVLQCDKAISG